MKNLFVLLLASSALISACSGDDDDSSGAAGSSGKSGSATSGDGGSGGGGKGGSGAGKAGMAPEEGGAPQGEGGAAAGAGGASLAQKFTVTLENVATVKPFTSSGVFNTPVGAGAPGALTPGNKYEFTVDAGRKQKLSFATMLAATNDLFFGPSGDGIALYDDDGEPITGDVTDQIRLWDAGTELNEEPKVGPNTVSKQAAPDTGPAEHGDVVDIADTTDTFDYPSADEVMTVTVTHLTGTEFKVTIEN
ncbi:MAG TPA: spondin domain-containing protein, partial [Polyangiaceae bacterium]|nr:spondin domain-containing protein [Polyangiaceae bacterium]